MVLHTVHGYTVLCELDDHARYIPPSKIVHMVLHTAHDSTVLCELDDHARYIHPSKIVHMVLQTAHDSTVLCKLEDHARCIHPSKTIINILLIFMGSCNFCMCFLWQNFCISRFSVLLTYAFMQYVCSITNTTKTHTHTHTGPALHRRLA